MPKAKDALDEPVGSIRESLGAAWDEQETVEAPEVEAVEETAETKTERARDETGKFTKAEKEEPEEKAEEVKAEEQSAVPVVDEIIPEEHWSDADKGAFTAIPVEHRKWVMDRYKRLEADNTRKSQEAASLRSYKQQFDAILQPYRQEFALAGLDEAGGVRYLLAVRDALKNKPAETLNWLAQQYGVDLRQVAEGIQPPDPATQAVTQQVNQFGQKLTQIEQSLQQNAEQQAYRMLDTFAQEKDATGNPKHPHFEAVVETMTQLMKSGMVQLGDLETAYKQAVLLKGLTTTTAAPATAPVTVAQPDKKKEELDKAAIAAKAKKAAAGVSGGTSKKTDRKMSLRDELAARVDGSLN